MPDLLYFWAMQQRVLIVGGGLAGTVLADKAAGRGLAVSWCRAPHIPAASGAAYGMLNPVHIRNAALSWKAGLLYPVSAKYFLDAAQEAERPIARAAEILHILSTEDEAVLWRQQAESGSLPGFATGEAEHPVFRVLNENLFGFTRITQAVFVDIPAFLEHTAHKLQAAVTHLPEAFCHGLVQWKNSTVEYAGTVYDCIIFCEGIHALQNPWFSALPFRPCKGEVLTLQVEGPELPVILHRKVFLIPLGGGQYRAGATYNWTDTSFTPTDQGREEILTALREWVKAPVTVTGHTAGVRPAIADRRPVTGLHPVHAGLAIFNGLGSRGLIQAPLLADMLLDHLFGGGEIWPEVNVKRFNKRLA